MVLTKLHLGVVASKYQTNKESTVSVIVCEQRTPDLAEFVVGADVMTSPFNWHFGPFPLRPMRIEHGVG